MSSNRTSNRERAYDVGIVLALLLAIGFAVAVAWYVGGASPSAAFNARTQIVLVGVTTAAGVIALWYAYLTRQIAQTAQRQAASAERQITAMEAQLRIADGQLEAARQQLALMNQEIHDTRLARLQDQKPVVFVDRVEHPTDPGSVRYVVRNVGGGFALNVYYFDVMMVIANSIGTLAAGEERTLPAEINRALCDGGAGIRCLLVAEAPFTRTTQWTPTLNFRTQTAGHHKGQVMHRVAEVAVAPPRFENQGLSDYMTANHKTFREQLAALSDQDHLGPRLLEQRGRESRER